MRRRNIALLVVLLLLTGFVIIPFAIPLNEDGVDPRQLAGPDGAFITLQGVTVYYETLGEPDAPTVLFIHGLYGSTASWRYNMADLAAAGYRVIAYDRPGFGLSDKAADFDYALNNQVDLALALLDALGVGETAVVGHSAGAKTAVELARRQPERVTQLVLVDALTTAGGPPAFVGRLVELPPVWQWARIGLQAYFTRQNLEASLGSFYVNPSFLEEADYDAYWRAFQTPGWDVALLALTRDSAGEQMREEDLRQITTDTLLLWGEQDATTPLAQGENLARLLPNSELVVIPQSGHQPFEEQAEAFNTALLLFLRR
ncbi:MAG: alpha/beta hydrolase [Chloroflexi bacterium]|nr:alpha/beta hydrolase [Chloroflexota bacterium]